MNRATRTAAPRIAYASGPWTAANTRSLYTTCLHEFAHLAAARSFGACGFVTVQRLGTGDLQNAKWQGRFQLFGALDDDAWRVVALAGTLAERLFDGHPANLSQLARALRLPGALSYCDAALARGFDRDHVDACIAVVSNAWAAIIDDATERAAEISERLASMR
jgi:hypothetical protein